MSRGARKSEWSRKNTAKSRKRPKNSRVKKSFTAGAEGLGLRGGEPSNEQGNTQTVGGERKG